MGTPVRYHGGMRSLCLLSFFAACSPSDVDVTDTDGSPDVDPAACHTVPMSPVAPRHLVVAQPYNADFSQSQLWHVFQVLADGELARTDTFEMGRAFSGAVRFTPDGQIGAVPQDDGTIGLFSLDAKGIATVISAGFGEGAVYASEVRFAPDAETLYAVDGNWVNNGGGIYAISVDCDGQLGVPMRILEAKLPGGLTWDEGPERAVLFSIEVDGAPETTLHTADLTLGTWLDHALAFVDGAGQPSEIVITDNYLVVGDTDEFAGHGGRVASLTWPDLLPVAEARFRDPVSLLNVEGDRVLCSMGYADAVIELAPDATHIGDRGHVSAQLPGTLTMLRSGALASWAWVGTVDGVMPMSLGEGMRVYPAIAVGPPEARQGGAIGVQP
ncbi:MAG: hypothetical protein ACI9MC_002832 [Kiritimatiellia bacterium]|jgi:hypothetical protein